MAPLEQQGSKEKGMTNHDMGVHIQKEDPPWGKMLNHAWSGNGSKRAQSVKPISKGNRRKGGLDTPGGEKTERKGDHHTLTLLA